MTLLRVILYHPPWSSNTASVAAAASSFTQAFGYPSAIIDLRTIMHHFNPMERLIQLNLEHMQALCLRICLI